MRNETHARSEIPEELGPGTAASIADELQAWFEQGAADDFNVMTPLLPSGLDDFANQRVRELQRRGLFRTSYEGRTLRDRLGLPAVGKA